MGTEIDDIEDNDSGFEAALADRRHKELISALRGVISATSKPTDNKPDSSIKEALDRQTSIIKEFVELLRKSENKEKQEVKVYANQDKVVNSVDIMAKSILDGLNDLKTSLDTPENPKEFEFTVTRNRFSDLIEKVVAKQIK